MNSLQSELTKKISLPFGVRSVYTPSGHRRIDTLDELEHNGQYVCSSNARARGVHLEAIKAIPSWHVGRVPSGRRALNAFLRKSDREVIVHPPKRPRRAFGSETESDSPTSLYFSRTPKKMLVYRNGDMSTCHRMFINRHSRQTFENLLDDLSSMFQMNIRRLHTINGRQVGVPTVYIDAVNAVICDLTLYVT